MIHGSITHEVWCQWILYIPPVDLKRPQHAPQSQRFLQVQIEILNAFALPSARLYLKNTI